MPTQGKLLLLPILMATLAGCAQFLPAPVEPSTPGITLDEARALFEEYKQERKETPPIVSLSEPVQCIGFAPLNKKLVEQGEKITALNKQVESLTQATPSFANSVCPASTTQTDGKIIVGSTEWIYLNPPGHHYLARVDSGATTSSISAKNIVRFERNGKKWVSFELKPDDNDESIEVEAPLVRNVLIRQASAEESDRRPVVLLNVHLGPLQQEAEFTLTDRSQMSYPMLLGRSFLQDVALIDVGKEFTQPKFEIEDTPPAHNSTMVVKPKTEAKPEAKPAVKAEAKPAVKAETKAEAKPEVKPEAKPEASTLATPAPAATNAAEPQKQQEPTAEQASPVSE